MTRAKPPRVQRVKQDLAEEHKPDLRDDKGLLGRGPDPMVAEPVNFETGSRFALGPYERTCW
jgi:hypothetical protein